ncbi:MAG: alpha/beta hydrolase [Ktedonobacteraceae bacterium]
MLTHHDAQLQDIRLHYVTDGDGPLLLFVHGFPEFWYEWKHQLAAFAHDYKTVAFDMRGYNLSEKPQDVAQYALPHLVNDIKALIEHLGYKTCILVGHDWGGVTSWAFALTYPEMLEKLIIVNAPHPFTFRRELLNNPAQKQASQYMKILYSSKAEQLLSENNYERLVRMSSFLHAPEAEQDRAVYREAWSQPGALTACLNYYRATNFVQENQAPLADDKPLAVPTLVIWGKQDTAFVLETLDGLDQLITTVNIHYIPDGSHWVIHEKPEEVNATIQAFLNAS